MYRRATRACEGRKKVREMDSTDKAVFGTLMGGTAMRAVECRREMATENEGNGWGGGGGTVYAGAVKEKVFPELGK